MVLRAGFMPRSLLHMGMFEGEGQIQGPDETAAMPAPWGRAHSPFRRQEHTGTASVTGRGESGGQTRQELGCSAQSWVLLPVWFPALFLGLLSICWQRAYLGSLGYGEGTSGGLHAGLRLHLCLRDEGLQAAEAQIPNQRLACLPVTV